MYATLHETTPPREWTTIPRIANICELEPFARHINAPRNVYVTAETFTEATVALPALLSTRRAALLAVLARMLREAPGAGEWGLPIVDADALALATTVFVCSNGCQDKHNPYIFGGAGALTHHCSEDCPRTFIDPDKILYHAASPPATLSLSMDSWAIAEALVRKAGRDPVNTTIDEMDRADVRFGCMVAKCAEECLGFDWRRAVHVCLLLQLRTPDILRYFSGRPWDGPCYTRADRIVADPLPNRRSKAEKAGG